MVVVVVGPDRDDGDPRAQDAEEVGETGVLGAMVGDLEDLDRTERQPGRDVALGIGREEDVRRAVAGERDHRVLIRVLAGESRIVGPEDPQLELAQREHLAGVEKHDGHAASMRGREDGGPVG